MTDKLVIALAQLNPTVGKIGANLKKLREMRKKAAEEGADLILTSELYTCGYPPEDLVRKPQFISSLRSAVEAFASETSDGGPAVLLGTPWVESDRLHNSIVLIDGGVITTCLLYTSPSPRDP